MPTALCTSTGLICCYITGFHFCLWAKEASHHVSHEICCNLLEFMSTVSYTLIITTYATQNTVAFIAGYEYHG